MSIPAPFTSQVLSIEKDWIDYNGHLNMAYYNVLFDRALDEVFIELGMGPDYANTRRLTTYTAEMHICYVRELHLTDTVRATAHLIDFDEKRFQFFQELHHVDGWLAATCETLTLHVDMSGPKVTPMPDDVLSKIKAMHEAHSALPHPERAGRAIGIKRK